MTQADEPSSPPHAPVPRPVEAMGSDHDDLIDEPDVPLSEFMRLIGNRERARACLKFRTAAALGIALPAIMLTFGYFFISSVAQTKCLRVYGGLGTCDPLHQIAAVTVIGQMLILEVAIGAMLWPRGQPPDQRKVAGIYSAVGSSVGWALITGLFAAQWMSGNP